MTRVDHFGPLDEFERSAVEKLLSGDGEFSIDESRSRPPRVYRATGKMDILVPLAWLVVTFVGGGAVLLIKEFLKGIASELGKKLVERYTQRNKESSFRARPRIPIVVVYEPDHGKRTAILIPWAPHELPQDAPDTIVEVLGRGIPAVARGPAPDDQVLVHWDAKMNRWIVTTGSLGKLGEILWRGEANRYPDDPDEL